MAKAGSRPRLSTSVQVALKRDYSSIAHASERLGLSYERLKKALQRNRFSEEDLKALIPGESIEALRAKYDFEISRGYPELSKRMGKPRTPPAPAGSENADLLGELKSPFKWLHAAANATVFDEFVGDMYKNMGPNTSMVLFCHDTAVPIEWEEENAELLDGVCSAINKGAVIIYVVESDLINYVVHKKVPPDNIDGKFQWYLKDVRRRCASTADPSGSRGFIALLRVPHCAFCIPYQKPALFITRDGEKKSYRALTTIQLSKTVNGAQDRKGDTVVLPQAVDVASTMVKYLRQLIYHLDEDPPDPDFETFHFFSSVDEAVNGRQKRDNDKSADALRRQALAAKLAGILDDEDAAQFRHQVEAVK